MLLYKNTLAVINEIPRNEHILYFAALRTSKISHDILRCKSRQRSILSYMKGFLSQYPISVTFI